MQTRQHYNFFTYAWLNGLPIDNEMVNLAAWGFPVPDELFLTEAEIQEARPHHTMTLEEQMAVLTVDPRQQRWYVEAIQRKYCSCHMELNYWCHA